MQKIIVISGGSEGLGKEIARVLTGEHKVIILSSNKTKLAETAGEIGCEFKQCDVSDYQNCSTVIEKIIQKYKKIDCLINNAAIWIEGELDTNEPDRIAKVLNVNTTGLIFLTKAVVPFMKKEKKGLIINIISQAGLYGKRERSVYDASKWAVTGFTKSLQPELSKYGVVVTGIYPGKMNTKMFEKIGIHKDMSDSIDPVVVAKTIKFLLSFENDICFPEIGIKNSKS